MVGNQDSDILMFQASYDCLDILYGDRVYTGKRLIQHNELRIDRQTAGNLRTTPLSTRKLVSQVFTNLIQTEL